MPRRHRPDSTVRRYNEMEGILNSIHGYIVSLPKEKTKKTVRILNRIFIQILSAMFEKNNDFRNIYRSTFYGGSYYDGVRVKEANEFDLDIVLDISRVSKPSLVSSDVPGFVHLENSEANTSNSASTECNGYCRILNVRESNALSQLDHAVPALFKNFWKISSSINYLHTGRVLTWINRILTEVLNDCDYDRNGYILRNDAGNFHINISRSGPALTLHIAEGNRKIMDVDLVVCFVFGEDHWPADFTPNTSDTKSEFFIVPKAPTCSTSCTKPKELYWRLSFQEQERELINDKKRLKPVLRLLKKLRDNQHHNFISSYYLKTVLLLMVETTTAEGRPGFWNTPLSFVFMSVLYKYQEYLECQNIPYFWNRNYNLLANVGETTLRHLSNEVNIIIGQLEKSKDDPQRCSKILKMRLLNNTELGILERFV